MLIRGRRVILPEGERAASITIQRETIVGIGAYDVESTDADVVDAGDLVVSPGIVDTHVHVNEPGRTEWEGFDTATRAAAAGGVTTIVDMPLNSVPATTSVAALEAKRAAARGQCLVDVAFWGGVVPGNDTELEGLVDAGVRGFKCFLVPSGVDEFANVDERDLRRAMPILARRGVPLLVHAEDPRDIADFGSRIADPKSEICSPQSAVRNSRYSAYLATRPVAAEVAAVDMMIALAREFEARVHIVHVSSGDAADRIAGARASGVPITAETCPHYLTFAAEDIPDGATAFKCAPPIRTASHRDALWDALRRGSLDLVATDHSPAPPALKCPGDFRRAWGGIASLELSLPAVWTGARQRGFGVTDLARWMSAAPAQLAGLEDRKGAIAPGRDADLIVWDPDAGFTVHASCLHQRHKVTPYSGLRLSGVVRMTIRRGERVWDAGRIVPSGGGHLL